MSVKFKVLKRKNPQEMSAPEKFYAAAIADGQTDLDRLAELISYQCTVTAADSYAVLMSLEHNIVSELSEGRIVKLGRLGNFQVSVSSEGKATAQEVNSGAIIKNRIIFRPGKKLRDLLSTLTYSKAS